MDLPGELRLLIATLLNVAVFVSAYRFAKRRTLGADWIACAFDALLLCYVVQYLAICLPGIVGILNPLTMSLTGVALAAALWLLARDRELASPTPPQAAGAAADRGAGRLLPIACLLFVLGYLGGIVSVFFEAPPLVDDALTYHLPAAVQWLRTGHIGLYTTWFFNPANTYSPMAGSTFMAWLIAPMGNDVLSRWVQMPPIFMMYLGLIELARAMGVRSSIASIIAAAAVLSRPLSSQSFEVKDDLFAAAFFVVAVVGCAPAKLRDPLGPWRIGAALGLFAATKYTALLSAPIFLLLIDAPFRAGWRWRRWLILFGTALLLAGPWFIRNWIVAGNPLYPIPVSLGPLHLFDGLFVATRSTEMNSLTGIWDCITDRRKKFHSPSPALMITLLGACVIAAVLMWRERRRLLRDPLTRTCVLGAPLGLAVFIIASHAGEIRYIYPAILLLYASSALVASRLPAQPISGIVAALLLAALSVAGSFANPDFVWLFSAGGAAATLFGTAFVAFLWSPLRRHPRIGFGVGAITAIAIALVVYVYWPAYIIGCRRAAHDAWVERKGDPAAMWTWVEEHVPPDATIAYTNLYMIHPLLGFDHGRTLAYAPTRPDVHAYHDLPPSRRRVSDQEIRALMSELLTANPDRETWLANLAAIHPQYVIVGRQDVLATPPEQAFADGDPQRFEKLQDLPAGTVYRVLR